MSVDADTRLKDHLLSIAEEISKGSVDVKQLETLASQLSALNKRSGAEPASDDQEALYARLDRHFECLSECRALESELSASAPPIDELERESERLRVETGELEAASAAAKGLHGH